MAGFDGHTSRSTPLGHRTVAESCTDEEVFSQTCNFSGGVDLSGAVSVKLKRHRQGGWWVCEPTVGRTDFRIDVCTADCDHLPLNKCQLQMAGS